jgi:hypothetical protein
MFLCYLLYKCCCVVQELQPRFIPLQGELQQLLDTPQEALQPALCTPPTDPDTGITQRRLSNGIRINYRWDSGTRDSCYSFFEVAVKPLVVPSASITGAASDSFKLCCAILCHAEQLSSCAIGKTIERA